MISGFEKPSKPLTAGVGTVEQAEPTFFYKRNDGSIIMVKENEAWTLHANRNQVLGRRDILPFVQVGVSDGLLYQQAVNESREIFQTKGLEAAQARVRKGFDEELEAARGWFQVPRNYDFTNRDGSPIDLKTGDVIPPNRRYESRTHK